MIFDLCYNFSMKKSLLLLAAFCAAFGVFPFWAWGKESAPADGKLFPIEISVPESWAEVVNPRQVNDRSSVSKNYKVEFNGHVGEVRIYVHPWSGSGAERKDGLREACRSCMARDIFSSAGEISLPEIYDISSEGVARRVKADAAFRTDIVDRGTYPGLYKQYAYQYFFIKSGSGIVSYSFVSDEPGFFGFSDSTLSAVNPDCDYFLYRENLGIAFSDALNNVSPPVLAFDDFSCFSPVCSLSFVGASLSEEGVADVGLNGAAEKPLLSEAANFSLPYDETVLVRCYAFSVLAGDAKARETELPRVMERFSSYIIGYDDGVPFEKIKSAGAKKLNADDVWTKSSEKCLSPFCDTGRRVQIDVLYSRLNGILFCVSTGSPAFVEKTAGSGSIPGAAFLRPSELAARTQGEAFSFVSDDGNYVVCDLGAAGVVRRVCVKKIGTGEVVLDGFYRDADALLSGDEVRFVRLHADLSNVSDKNLSKFLSKKKMPESVRAWVAGGKSCAVTEKCALNLRTRKVRSLGQYEYVNLP